MTFRAAAPTLGKLPTVIHGPTLSAILSCHLRATVNQSAWAGWGETTPFGKIGHIHLAEKRPSLGGGAPRE